MFFFPGWNRYPKKKITQKIELVTWHWASNISIYVFVPYIIADVTGSMWRYWLNFFSDFYFFGKKLSQYDDIEPVRCPELVRCHWASTMTLSQYDDTDSTVRPTFLVGPSEMKENDSFYHPQNSPWQQSFWFLSSDYIRTLENWASKEIWDGTQNEVDWVQKDSREKTQDLLRTTTWKITSGKSKFMCHCKLWVSSFNSQSHSINVYSPTWMVVFVINAGK